MTDMMVNRWEEEVSLRVDRAKSSFDKLDKIYNELTSKNKSMELIEVANTPHRAHHRFLKLLSSANTEVLGFNRSPYSFFMKKKSNKKITQQSTANDALYNKGVKTKSIYMYEKEYWSHLERDFERSKDDESNIMKIIDYLPMKLFIFDRKTTIYSLNSIQSEYDEGLYHVIIHDIPFAESCCELFDLYWNRAEFYDAWKEKRKVQP